MRTRTNSREVRLLGSGSKLASLHNATNDANKDGGSSSDAGGTNTGGNNSCSQDSSRRRSHNRDRSSRNTARRLEHQIQTLHALQPWLDWAPKQPDRARREVVRDIFSYFNTSTEVKARLVPHICYPRVVVLLAGFRDRESRNLQCRRDELQGAIRCIDIDFLALHFVSRSACLLIPGAAVIS
jgi:hypothetical protein